jgi:hypothetical protein
MYPGFSSTLKRRRNLFKILEKDFIESTTKVQAMCKENSKVEETMGRKE